MKKLIIPLAALLFSIGTLHAQNTTPTNKTKPTTTQKPSNAPAQGAQQDMAKKSGKHVQSKSVATAKTDKIKPKKSMAKHHKKASKKSVHHS